MKNKKIIFLMLLILTLLLPSCNNTNNKEAKIATKEILGLDKVDPNLQHNYFKIIDDKGNKTERLLKSENIILEIIKSTEEYITKTKSFDFNSYTGDEDLEFLTMNTFNNFLEMKKNNKDYNKKITNIKNELIKYEITSTVLEVKEPSQIIVSPNEDKAAVFVEYIYAIESPNKNAIENKKTGIFMDMIIINFIKENNVWKVEAVLDPQKK